MDTTWINLLLGGAGVAILTAAGKFLSDIRKSRVMRDDTAIAGWRELRDEKKAEADKAWRIVSWYRGYYPKLWAAYVQARPEDRDTFPPAPPSDID